MTDDLDLTGGGVPQSLIDVAEALGLPLALRLMAEFGGRDIVFPVNPAPDHPVVHALGLENARALCHFLSGAKIYVPHGHSAARRRQVADLSQTGLTRGQIARRLGLSQRHVRRLANAAPGGDPRQGGLFDD